MGPKPDHLKIPKLKRNIDSLITLLISPRNIRRVCFGCCFLAEKHQEQLPERGSGKKEKGKAMHKILIADDEVIERALLERKLKKSFAGECEVISAGNGKEVLEADASFAPDILILDVEMPVVNGLEAARELRHRGRRCAIIFLTAYDDFLYAKQAISVHAVDYLLKPCDEKELLLAVEEAMRWCDTQKEMAAVNEPPVLRSAEESESVTDAAIKQEEKDSVPGNQEHADEDPKGNQIRLLSFIYDHYMEDISVQDLSEHMGYSEVHTSRLFKQYFGQTFVSYLAHYRMKKAAHLLMYTDMSVREIGRAVGYSNSNYFGKVFHRIYETTPSEYREHEKNP